MLRDEAKMRDYAKLAKGTIVQLLIIAVEARATYTKRYARGQQYNHAVMQS